MIDPETPKVIAKAGEEFAKLGQETIKFVNRIAGGPLEEIGGFVQDQFAFMRAKRRMSMAQILDTARKQLEAGGVEAQEVPLKVLEPILNRGSLEEHDTMVNLWAGLLASAANPNTKDKVDPAFPAVLAELSPEQGELLEWFFAAHQQLNEGQLLGRHVPMHEFARERSKPHTWTVMTMENFLRLRIIEERITDIPIERDRSSSEKNPRYKALVKQRKRELNLSAFGAAFLMACHPNQRQK